MELLHTKKLSREPKSESTLQYVDVREIRDGAIVLNNGSLRAILLVSSINFDLKSSDEQDAVISQYQNFLNSLDFPIQILVSSRKLNITPYVETLGELEKQQRNELLRLQISEYRTFIRNLTEITNIMSKFFYIVVPFSPVENTKSGIFDKITELFNPKQVVTNRREIFETYKNQLWQRVDHVVSALSGTGVRLTPLDTEELIELLYNAYNPSLFTNTVLKNIDQTEVTQL